MFHSLLSGVYSRLLARVFKLSAFGFAALLTAPDVSAEDSPATQSWDTATTSQDLARSVAVTGREAYNAGDYETAVTLFRRAYALYPAPTVVLYEARSLERMGLLLEAADAYAKITQLPLNPGAPAQFAEAVSAARQEGRALVSRIPTVLVKLEGVSEDDPSPQVSLDGQSMDVRQIGKERRLNPGTYRITASLSDGRTDRAEAVLVPGQHLVIILHLGEKGDAANQAGGNDKAAGSVNDSAVAHRIPVLAYVVGGIGVTSLGAGVVTGVLANSKHTKAEAACPDHQCAPGSDGFNMVSAFRTLRTASTVSYGVGAAGLAAGVILWLTASDDETTQGHSLEPWVTAHTAGLRGTF
jgi:hypothetical protein